MKQLVMHSHLVSASCMALMSSLENKAINIIIHAWMPACLSAVLCWLFNLYESLVDLCK